MKRPVSLWSLLIPLLALCASSVPAQDMAELTVDHNVVSEYVTPHTDWATPYAQGKTKALFFVRGHGVGPREVIELGQRFDLDPQMVFWAQIVDSPKEGWHGGENGIRRMDRLLQQKWDVFVFLGIPVASVPTEQQYKLLRQVADGAGLVLRGQDDKRVLKDKNRIKDVPSILGDVPDAAAFSIKQGRAVRLAPQPGIAYAPGWEVEYDQWARQLGQAVLWAAGREPKASLRLEPLGKEIARAMLPGAVATLKWSGATAGAVADLVLRRDDGVTITTFKQSLDRTSGEAKISLPLVRAGRYWLDAVNWAGKVTESFAGVSLTITSPRQVTGVALDRDWGEIGDKLTGKVACTGDLTAADERLVVSLLDPRGRELMRQDVGPVTTEGAFSFTIEDWLPMLATVRATLTNGKTDISSAWQFARVVKRHRNQFNFLIWDLPTGTLGPYGEESLARNGMTLQLSSASSPPPYVAANEIAWVPYTTRVLTPKDENGVMKPACWNDEAGIQAHVDAIVKKYEGSRRHGVFVYSLGDEGDVRGSCRSPQCLAAYQNYLEKEYGDIKALNASWGTNLGSFLEVQLTKADDDNEMEAFRAGNFPRWFDRQAYQSYNFCKLCERFGKGFKSIDPEALCGFEGAGTFGAADDLDGFVRSNTFWSPYPGTADEVVRSIAPRDFPRSNWMGYTKDADTLLEKYWRMVTRGTDSVWWWRWDCIGAFHGWLSPTLDPYPAVKEILRDTQIVRDGLGDLLLTSEMHDDSIGLLFSQPSAYATKVQTSPSFGAYEGDHTAWHTTLRGLGYNFRYITDRQMRLGEQKPDQFKVFILPLTQALSSAEAQMLREYVQNGGVLIADARPGIYDGHCKPLAAGSLDDVFGVKRTAFVEAQICDAEVKFTRTTGGQAKAEALPLPRVRVDAGLKADGASPMGAAGETPILMINSYGKGKAVLLNLPLASYPSVAADSTPELAAHVLKLLLAQGSVAPAYQVNSAAGNRTRNLEITRWQNGPVEFVSFFRHAGLPEAARVTLPREAYVYDLKARRELGKQKVLNLGLTPCRAQFFAFSSVPLKPVAIQGPGTAQPGTVARVTVQSPLSEGRQAVKLEVKLPGGQVADWLTRVVVTDRQGTQVKLPVAFNDPVGTWTVTATELCTNKSGVCQIVVK